LPQEAEKLIHTALSGNPEPAIEEELRDLLEQVTFRRHLKVRGVLLSDDEVQLSLAGGTVGYGIVPARTLLSRVELTETLLYRTAERRLGRSYREQGRPSRGITSNLQLYMSIPRAASFAVTFRVGNIEQPSLPGFSLGEQVIDEALDCLELFSNNQYEQLNRRIGEEAYYRNFIALAKGLSPDGVAVTIVGFTRFRGGEEKVVALPPRGPAPRAPSIVSESLLGQIVEIAPHPERVVVAGTLLRADSITGGRNEITIVSNDEKRYRIIVPLGMMADIVRPLWETEVVVTGSQESGRIILEDIEIAPESGPRTTT
jgi:hypothetical protein